KIIDVARNMIRLSGKQPETEIQIAFVGVRPGEKLHEELWTDGETVGPTSYPKILRAARSPIDVEGLPGEAPAAFADRRRGARGAARRAGGHGRARGHARRRLEARVDAARAPQSRLRSS